MKEKIQEEFEMSFSATDDWCGCCECPRAVIKVRIIRREDGTRFVEFHEKTWRDEWEYSDGFQVSP